MLCPLYENWLPLLENNGTWFFTLGYSGLGTTLIQYQKAKFANFPVRACSRTPS